MKRVLLGLVALLVLGAGITWFAVGRDLYLTSQLVGRDTAPADYAIQDDSKVSAPKPEPVVVQPRNPLKNVYWGDTHVHTHESFDAALFGTTLSIEDAPDTSASYECARYECRYECHPPERSHPV